MTDSPALEIVNLRVDYGNFTAVSDLSLNLAAGEIFGLAGPNGAGKTSTIRVLASLLEPTYGDVKVLGHDLFEAPERARSKLGYMPDLAPVIPNLKVWEFLDLYAHSYGYAGSEKSDRVEYCLGKVKLTDKPIYLLLTHQFEYAYVHQHSSLSQPTHFLVSAAW
ncbi:MAG: ABC transporter ATP-binding protein, partial [Gammaproteobacteria bacterium]|nr:ABC transporter ATP-binding protein [Gammaproteobacteria bacterium]